MVRTEENNEKDWKQPKRKNWTIKNFLNNFLLFCVPRSPHLSSKKLNLGSDFLIKNDFNFKNLYMRKKDSL